MDSFTELSEINDLIEVGDEQVARDKLIKLLDSYRTRDEIYPPVLNHLIRRAGLYPYLQLETADWGDRLAVEAFTIDVGAGERRSLHREQSALLARLLKGDDIAVSAPTSFGKSFVIDAFISLAKPSAVLLIVPTIALMDETRRRLSRKFGKTYRIITTTDAENINGPVIFVFPQERAITYANRIERLDLFVVDEFYKASVSFDKVRSPSLMRAIIYFSSITKQRYFLAPNISSLKANPFTKGMEFLRLDFNTVVLHKEDLSDRVGGDVSKKSAALIRILSRKAKTLIYAGSYPQIAQVCSVLEESQDVIPSLLLFQFSDWLRLNYSESWNLPRLVKKGIGIHNGQIHRSLSQIQVKLFEDTNEIDTIVSTSSIIEGVNTSAERVILWGNKNGASKLTDFDFRNIVGRGGRMFRHFIGEVFVLEKPPIEEDRQLDIDFPESLLGISEEDVNSVNLSDSQRQLAAEFEAGIDRDFDLSVVRGLQAGGKLQSGNAALIRKIVSDVASNPVSWRALANLNSANTQTWDWILYKVINMDSAGWEAPFNKVVGFIRVLSQAWDSTIPQLLKRLKPFGIGIDEFFKLERIVTFKLSSLLSDINAIHSKVAPDRGFDISGFITRASHAFLPRVVYQLEEYGLPRMLSKKVHASGIVDLQDPDLKIEQAVNLLLENRRKVDAVLDGGFEQYVVEYFFEGVSIEVPQVTLREERDGQG
jgi:hypothetical protein